MSPRVAGRPRCIAAARDSALPDRTHQHLAKAGRPAYVDSVDRRERTIQYSAPRRKSFFRAGARCRGDRSEGAAPACSRRPARWKGVSPCSLAELVARIAHDGRCDASVRTTGEGHLDGSGPSLMAGLHLGSRMTAFCLSNGRLLLRSPCQATRRCRATLRCSVRSHIPPHAERRALHHR
jgi:hypothetical protein